MIRDCDRRMSPLIRPLDNILYLGYTVHIALYTGAPIPVGYKSVAFSLTLRADDQTLTDDHAEETMQSVLKALKETFNATIR